TGNLLLHFTNLDAHSHTVVITDNAYKAAQQVKTLSAAGSTGAKATVLLNLQNSQHWYDFTVTTQGSTSFSQSFAGHVETGQLSTSDPKMGG
ncbi:DUF756 domain-containing protein, partial [Escherichia coli]|uniref:phospholipase domain-containing protein n=1 Tax=Escherichia coli TaxID=562 RepID=UPI0013247F7F